MIYNYADTVIIAWLRGDTEVGWYSAAYKLYEGPALVPAIIGTVFMPRLSRLFVENRERFVAVLRQGIRWIVVAAAGVTVIGIAIAGWLVRLSYGDTFANSVIALRILLAGILFAFTIQFLQTVMISIDRQRTVFWVAITGLGVNVVLNLLVVPIWGYIGASWATVAVEGLACAALSIFAWKAVRAPSFLEATRVPGMPRSSDR
jgi:O-antigen/teichoic acid export membrane protein